MKHSQLQMFSEKCDKFMYSKPDSQPKSAVAALDKNIDSYLNESVHQVFPDILSMEAFFSFAGKEVDSWDLFCVLVIRVDEMETGRHDAATETDIDDMRRIGKILGDFCQKEKGFWGLPESGLLGCFFPDKDDAAGLEIAKGIQEQAGVPGLITVSVGVAAWPLLSFEKKEVLTNAKKALDHAFFFGPSSAVCFDAVSLNISGDNLYQKGNIDGAITEFETALLIDPENINVRNSLGVCYGVKEEHEKAMGIFESLMQTDPGEIMAVYNAGMVSLKMGKKEEALKLFLKAETIDGNHFEVAFQTGRLFLEMKEYEKAREYLEKAATISPESGPAQRFLGECYSRLNFIEGAIDAYSKAVKLNASDATSLSALGCLYMKKGENHEIATLFCRQSVSLSPQTAVFRHRLGKVYLNSNRLGKALAEFKKAAELGHDCRKYIEEIQSRLSAGISSDSAREGNAEAPV